MENMINEYISNLYKKYCVCFNEGNGKRLKVLNFVF